MLTAKRKIPQYDHNEILEAFRRLSGYEVELCSDYLKYNKPLSCFTTVFPVELHAPNGPVDVTKLVRRNENGVDFLPFGAIVDYVRDKGQLPAHETILVE